MEGITLEQAENVKLLGLKLDLNLSFYAHTDSLYKKVSRRIGIQNRIKSYLPRAERVLFYNSQIKMLLRYFSVTWTSCCGSDS